MGNSFSSNALLSKTLALYGHRLTQEDYTVLLAKPTMKDMVLYLKNHKRYEHILEGFDVVRAKRNQLEELLNRDLFSLFLKFKAFSTHDKDFVDFLSLKMQTLEVANKIRHLFERPNELYSPLATPGMWKLFKFSQTEFCTADSFEDLFSCLGHLPISSLLKPYEKVSLSTDIINHIDLQLKDFYYQTVLSKINRGYSGQEKNLLISLYKMEIDLYNISTIYRLKKFYEFPQTEIRKHLLTTDKKFGKILEQLLQVSEVSEFFSVLKDTKYGDVFESIDQLEKEISTIMYKNARRHIHSSTSPMVVFTCYILLAKIEWKNVIHLIEGVKYKIPVEEIENLLII